ncbi:MAG: hypothetical protein PHU51_05875, partial [Candidatus Nanoarchaeia archaeon]|nr:hypothetical protein [Candidatus Nanoarchaeia archaeon]
ASEGLLLLGNQGGLIYTDQGGLTNRSDLELGEDYFEYSYREILQDGSMMPKKFNISYGIRDEVNCPNFFKPEPIIDFVDESKSHYPAKTTYLSDFYEKYNSYYFSPMSGCAALTPSVGSSGYLGENNLEKLCDREGINVQLAGEIFTCLPSAYSTNTKPNSIQEQLSVYIKNNLNSCFNFSIYEEMGASIRETGDEINISVAFTNPDGILIYAKYPFFVDVNGRSILTVAQFSGELDVDIKSLYYFIHELIVTHLKDPFFNLFESWDDEENIFFRSSFFLERIEKPCLFTGCSQVYDDVIKIGDFNSLIDGKPLTFYFAAKQRKPILEYMHQRGLTTVFNGKLIDYQYRVGDLITLEPFAIDPDNDSMKFNYSGWKETYDEVFDWDCCFDNGVIKEEGVWRKCVPGDLNCVDCTLESYHACVTPVDIEPRNWTGHPLFTPENGTSQIQTSESDAGYREVILSVKDEHGAMDFQIIRFLIFDFPEAVLTAFNLYPDVNDSWASIEDTYVLSGEDSTASVLAGGTLSQFIFSDLDEPFDVLKSENCVGESGDCVQATGPELTFLTIPNITGTTSIPSKTPWLDILTNSDGTRWFDSKNNDFNEADFIEHTLQLIVRQLIGGGIIASPPDEKLVNVAQCLPHNYGDDSLEAYPYNGVVDFKNVCCASISINGVNQDSERHYFGGTFEDENTQCYETTSTMCYPFDKNENPIEFFPLNLALTETSDDGNVSDLTLLPPISAKYGVYFPDRMNDIVSLNYEQNCSGNRGNICSGDLSFSFSYQICNDLNNGAFARCQGPNVNEFNACQMNERTPSGCVNYSSGQSFEKTIQWYPNNNQTLIDRGFCNEEKSASISSPNGIALSNSGIFNCLATCNGQGSCSYWKIEHCDCDKGNTCDDVSADKFFDLSFTATKFYCKGTTGCTSTCESYTSYKSDKYACYCKTHQNSNPGLTTVDPYNYFFESKEISEPGTTKCCLSGTYIYDGTNIVCHDGSIAHTSEIKFNSNKVLFVIETPVFLYCNWDGTAPADWTSSNKKIVGTRIDTNSQSYRCENDGWKIYTPPLN